MRFRIEPNRWSTLGAALGAAALFGLSSAPAFGQSEIMDELLEKLKDKGVLSEDEYQALKRAREEERTEQRAVRRRQSHEVRRQSGHPQSAAVRRRPSALRVTRWVFAFARRAWNYRNYKRPEPRTVALCGAYRYSW
jgi:hypothetical protein